MADAQATATPGTPITLGQDLTTSVESLVIAINRLDAELYRVTRFNIDQYLRILDDIARGRGLHRRVRRC